MFVFGQINAEIKYFLGENCWGVEWTKIRRFKSQIFKFLLSLGHWANGCKMSDQYGNRSSLTFQQKKKQMVEFPAASYDGNLRYMFVCRTWFRHKHDLNGSWNTSGQFSNSKPKMWIIEGNNRWQRHSSMCFSAFGWTWGQNWTASQYLPFIHKLLDLWEEKPSAKTFDLRSYHRLIYQTKRTCFGNPFRIQSFLVLHIQLFGERFVKCSKSIRSIPRFQ